VEVIGGAMAVLLAGLVAFQLLGVGYAAVMADHAAEAAALAAATGGDPRGAAREAVPGWPAGAIDVSRRGGHLRVTLRPPSVLRILSGRLKITSEAVVATPANG